MTGKKIAANGHELAITLYFIPATAAKEENGLARIMI
jgi:hypothetical protein